MRCGASKAAGKKETSVCKFVVFTNVSYIYISYSLDTFLMNHHVAH